MHSHGIVVYSGGLYTREALQCKTEEGLIPARTSLRLICGHPKQTASTISEFEPAQLKYLHFSSASGRISLLPTHPFRWHRLSRHGFTDVMKDTVESFAQTTGGVHQGQQHQAIDFDLEVTDPLAKHEITLQFAAFRAPPAAGPGNDGRGGLVGAAVAIPTSLYFTYQFYTCLPTRTERMLLRPDGPKDRLYQVMDQ